MYFNFITTDISVQNTLFVVKYHILSMINVL